MTASLITLVLLGCMVLWILAWQRGSRFAIGIVVGVFIALGVGAVVRAIGTAGSMPVWVPALPFALIALALFAFGLLAWFWGDEQPQRLHEIRRTGQPESPAVE
jgi:hypothetical protein